VRQLAHRNLNCPRGVLASSAGVYQAFEQAGCRRIVGLGVAVAVAVAVAAMLV